MSNALDARIEWDGGLRFRTNGTSGHEVVLDSDRETNTAANPMEMALRALCACSATDVVVVLQKARQGLTRLEVTAHGERAEGPPAVYTDIHMVYHVAGENLQTETVERAVMLSQTKYCSLYIMLGATVKFTHEIVVENATA